MANDSVMTNAEILKTRRREQINAAIRYAMLIFVGLVMLYPLVWLVGASFKTNTEIFTEIGFIPSHIDFGSYIKGWKTGTEYTFATYFFNSFKMIVPKILCTMASAVLVGYAFARFNFWGKKTLFTILISSLMLPQIVLRVPSYLMFKEFGWLDSYLPIWVPSAFGIDVFFTFMVVQFLRGIPQDMEEAAQIDGCNSFQVLWHIIIPLLKPALASVVVFQFIWTMNDFMGPLIYISSVEKYPVSLALRMAVSADSDVEWSSAIAISVVALTPSILVFFSAQRYFVQGIASTGVKG
jgi:oligogalacturonide transport system permease protein